MAHRAINTSVLASLRWSEDSLWCQDVFCLFLVSHGHFGPDHCVLLGVELCFIADHNVRGGECPGSGGEGEGGGVIKRSRCDGRISALQRRIN